MGREKYEELFLLYHLSYLSLSIGRWIDTYLCEIAQKFLSFKFCLQDLLHPCYQSVQKNYFWSSSGQQQDISMQEKLPCFNFQAIHRSSNKALQKLPLKGKYKFPRNYHDPNKDFPDGSDSKESACNVGDLGSIPGLGSFLGGGHGNPLQYSCLENPHRQRSLVGYIVHGVSKSQT